MSKIRVLKLAGSNYEMGKRHGEAFSDAIHKFTEDRIKLSSSEYWTGRTLPREEILSLAQQCVAEHEAYSPELMDELRGMADATGLSLAGLIINNGFTDFIDVVYNVGEGEQKPGKISQFEDNCTAFMVPKARSHDGNAVFGQTWDMHESATPYVILLHGTPETAPRFLTFTITGCVGMIGMNEAGITVGINNLMALDGQVGVTWPFIVRKILAQTNLDDAVDCVTSAKRAGAHNYLLMDQDGNGYNIEAMSTTYHIEKLEDNNITHTNHCVIEHNRSVERDRTPESLKSSMNRLSQANTLLERDYVSIEDLMALTRDKNAICVTSSPPFHVESCGAAIMRPSTGDFWAVWGLPSENEYEHFTV